MLLVRVEPRGIAATWPRIEAMVAAACKRSSGRYTAPLIRQYAERGNWQIWLAIDAKGEISAVAATKLVLYDTGLRSIFILMGTGRERRKWQHFMDDILAWGKAQGCALAEGNFRKGWRRVLPGWTHTHDSLEQVL